MKTGSIVDFYDDPNGLVLQQKLASVELPEFIKTAQFLDDEQRDKLPDDVFALVMVDQGEPIRKYACTDPGNTALNVIYFLENKDKLPEEAQKVAAANLLTACGWYDLEVPAQLSKIAGVGGLMQGIMGASQLKGKISQGVARHNAMMAPKLGDLSGTQIMPKQSDNPEDEGKTAGLSEAFQTGRAIREAKGTLKKVVEPRTREFVREVVKGRVKDLVSKHKSVPERIARHVGEHAEKYLAGAGGATALGVGAGVAHHLTKDQGKKKKAEVLQPYVDVTGLSPAPKIEKVASQHTLLRGQFPVDTYGELEQAQRWFQDYGESLHPADRREYCIKLAARADELGADVVDRIKKYAGHGYAPDSDIELAVSTRMQFWSDDGPERDMLKGLLEKRASVEPAIFCEALRQFDELTGLAQHWDSHVFDPFLSTFGIDKTASENWVFEHGGDRVDEPMLKQLVLKDHKQLCKKFGKEVAEELTKRPREIFSSLPLDSKRIIMRMANDPQP